MEEKKDLLRGDGGARRRGKSVFARPIVMALLVQAAILAIAGTIVVVVVEGRSAPEAQRSLPTIVMPQRIPEPRLQVAEFVRSVAPAALTERIHSQMPSVVNFPELPKLSERSTQKSQVASYASEMTGMFGDVQSALAEGSGKGMTSFLGIEDHGERILILFDVSVTVVNKARRSGVPMGRIRDEAMELIRNLQPNMRFGLIQFSRIYETFHDALIPASKGNRERAVEWMHHSFANEAGTIPGARGVRSYPRGIETVLSVAFAMQPEVIYLISDGAFWRTSAPGKQQRVPYPDLQRLLERLHKENGRRTRIHFIGFEMRESDKKALTSIIRSTGGTLVEMRKAAGG